MQTFGLENTDITVHTSASVCLPCADAAPKSARRRRHERHGMPLAPADEVRTTATLREILNSVHCCDALNTRLGA